MKKAKNTKTKIKLLRREDIWQPHRPGNRNAWKTGLHTAGMKDLRRRLANFRRRAKMAMAEAER